MKTSDYILVVEGITDCNFIRSFLDCEIVITNGTSVPCETITYLKEASKFKNIIILTDPDYPGISIRNKISEYIPEALHAYVRKEVSIKKNKVGVAESTKEEILKAIESVKLKEKTTKKGNLTSSDLYSLGLCGSEKSLLLRKKISEHYCLGYNNAKALLRKLNEFGISFSDLKETVCKISNSSN